MSITVAMTFANRPYDPHVIELLHAWDLDSLLDNTTGYEDSKRAAIDSLGDDLLRWVTVEVEVPDAKIRGSLTGSLPTVHAGDVVVGASGSLPLYPDGEDEA